MKPRLSAPGSIRSIGAIPAPGGALRGGKARTTDPQPRLERGADRAIARANDPPVRGGGHPGRNLGKFLHKKG